MSSPEGVDAIILHAWLSARSVVRGLPLPVPDHGGYRVDTRSNIETARWVFPKVVPGLEELARSIREPRKFLKLCGTPEHMRGALSKRWQLHPLGYFMQAHNAPPARQLEDGYKVDVKRLGEVIEAHVISKAGLIAASGYAADSHGVFIYDRVTTQPEHRRKGLGHILMRTLYDARQHSSYPQLLVATEDGLALYSALGWTTISSYTTASISVS